MLVLKLEVGVIKSNNWLRKHVWTCCKWPQPLLMFEISVSSYKILLLSNSIFCPMGCFTTKTEMMSWVAELARRLKQCLQTNLLQDFGSHYQIMKYQKRMNLKLYTGFSLNIVNELCANQWKPLKENEEEITSVWTLYDLMKNVERNTMIPLWLPSDKLSDISSHKKKALRICSPGIFYNNICQSFKQGVKNMS